MTVVTGRDGRLYYKLDSRGSATDGEEWDDGPGGCVTEICICHGNGRIHSIQTTYKRQGTTLVSRLHGGKGDTFDIITLTEPLTWISGYYTACCLDPEVIPEAMDDPCELIASLRFGTDQATYGPFGSDIGEPFSFKCSRGISGFHGRSFDDDGGFLLAIGVYSMSVAKGYVDDEAAMPSLDQLRITG
ncbi:agglutinin-like [Typha angustifolia]|uniref:agglutinin-like n=1 Tax=Typha angustifolia TaxID=59011 RepID=UPI003C2C237F